MEWRTELEPFITNSHPGRTRAEEMLSLTRRLVEGYFFSDAGRQTLLDAESYLLEVVYDYERVRDQLLRQEEMMEHLDNAVGDFQAVMSDLNWNNNDMGFDVGQMHKVNKGLGKAKRALDATGQTLQRRKQQFEEDWAALLTRLDDLLEEEPERDPNAWTPDAPQGRWVYPRAF